MVIFHGGCKGCNMQNKEGLNYCVDCQSFECNWTLPNLNDTYIKEQKELEKYREVARKLKIKNCPIA